MTYYGTMRKCLEDEWMDENLQAGEQRARIAIDRVTGHTPKFFDYDEVMTFTLEYALFCRLNADNLSVGFRL